MAGCPTRCCWKSSPTKAWARKWCCEVHGLRHRNSSCVHAKMESTGGASGVSIALKRTMGNAKFRPVTNQDAYILRENTGTSGVMETARAAASTLADYDIPHLIVGGIAVQEHG